MCFLCEGGVKSFIPKKGIVELYFPQEFTNYFYVNVVRNNLYGIFQNLSVIFNYFKIFIYNLSYLKSSNFAKINMLNLNLYMRFIDLNRNFIAKEDYENLLLILM
jgi:hypothetical protein